jgi:hypothetical protein
MTALAKYIRERAGTGGLTAKEKAAVERFGEKHANNADAIGQALNNGLTGAIQAAMLTVDREDLRHAIQEIEALSPVAWRLLATPDMGPRIKAAVREQGKRALSEGRPDRHWKGEFKSDLAGLGVSRGIYRIAVKVIESYAERFVARHRSGFGMLTVPVIGEFDPRRSTPPKSS